MKTQEGIGFHAEVCTIETFIQVDGRMIASFCEYNEDGERREYRSFEVQGSLDIFKATNDFVKHGLFPDGKHVDDYNEKTGRSFRDVF